MLKDDEFDALGQCIPVIKHNQQDTAQQAPITGSHAAMVQLVEMKMGTPLVPIFTFGLARPRR